MRYAAYVRVSTDEQVVNFSLNAQVHAIESRIRAQNGLIAGIYVDEGESGRTCDRPAFQKMRCDARK